MPFADLLRRSSPQVAHDASSSAASTSYHGSAFTATPSSAKLRRSASTRERFTFGRSSKPRTSLDTDSNLLYPVRQLQPSPSHNRGSHYSTADDHSIGEAPLHAPLSKRPSAAPLPSISPLPHTPSLPSAAAASSAHIGTSPQISQYDRLFGLSTPSASVSPRRPTVALVDSPPLRPPLASSSSTRSITSSSAHQHTQSTTTSQVAHEPVSAAATTSASLLRRKSTKSRSPFPPASASTGTNSTPRDRSNMGTSIFRRPSLRRRNGSSDSTATQSEKIVQQMASIKPAVESTAVSGNSLPPIVFPSIDAVPVSTFEPIRPTSFSTGRFAKFFGRRKSVSSPVNVLPKHDLVVNPLPPLRNATFAGNRKSPLLAVISAGWQDSTQESKALKADADLNRTISSRTVVPTSAMDQTNSFESRRGSSHANALSRTNDSESSKVSVFTFPSRPSLSNDSAAKKEHSALEPARAGQAKHSTSRSLPLTSMPISGPIPISTSPDPTDPSATANTQRRPSQIGRSLSHRKSSKSLSMIGSMFASSSHSFSAADSPALPQSASTLSQMYPAYRRHKSVAAAANSSTSNHSRRPSLRARLKVGRNNTDASSQRPSTPEIESWKQRATQPIGIASPAQNERRSRASMDGSSRPKPAEMPVKIVRSKSQIRRKPAPEVKQEEIDSSSSTPVYGRTFRALEVDHDAGSPLGGRLASSPATQPAVLADSISDVETSPNLVARRTVPALSNVAHQQTKPEQREERAVQGLGLLGASTAPADAADTSVPSINILPSTPTTAADKPNSSINAAHHNLAPSASPSLKGKRLSSGVHSIADTSLSVERPWSLISAGEADTPLLKLRKLVVNTDASDDDSRDGDDATERLFFRPINSAGRPLDDEDGAPIERMTDSSDKSEAAAKSDSEQLRSTSQATTRSDTKHEFASIYSSGLSTIRAARGVAAQPSISGLSAASGALSDASQAFTIRMRNVPASLVAERDADSVGLLPAKSPAASQHSFRTRQHRWDGSTGPNFSQTTVQQAKRASTASRMTARSSDLWSESRLSEDALSALGAEVGQARRAEVVALGKGRVKDWVGNGGADRSLPMAEAPTLSRSNTLRKKSQANVAAADFNNVRVDEREAQRQKALNEDLSRRLQLLSDAQVGSAAAEREIRDIPDEESLAASPSNHQGCSAPVPRFVRLSAFHDRKLLGDVDQTTSQNAAPVTVTSQLAEEAIRLGRAPSNRVRRNVSETKSAGEAVMVMRDAANMLPRSSANSSVVAARRRRRSTSLSSRKAWSSMDMMNPTLVPALPTAPLLHVQDGQPPTDKGADVETAHVEDGSKQHSKQRSFATSEEAAQAKRQELLEREKRLAEKEARRQLQLQEKYAKKKQSDPLLAARLALAGLQTPMEAVPKLQGESLAQSAAASRSSLCGGSGLQVPEIAGRRASATGSPALLSVIASPMGRKNSNAGSVMSFHTAMDVATGDSQVVSASSSAKVLQTEPTAETSLTSKGSAEVRPDTSYSIASSLAVDFEFPVPPQRMKEQVSEDGTPLSRAGLQESSAQQKWREGRHYLPKSPQAPLTPRRDSSLRHRNDHGSKHNSHVSTLFPNGVEMPASETMPKLAAVSPLDSVKQSGALRRSRSVGYNNRDLRRMTREQMMLDTTAHASPQQWDNRATWANGLGIQMDETVSGGRKYSKASGVPRRAILA
ncbi:uncharacterized protein UHOD_02250 [Ustilago sp. UG-2017b]|nr:uncharacterized protein UHOD_02250 [Ustilago sp. UG-2017b]